MLPLDICSRGMSRRTMASAQCLARGVHDVLRQDSAEGEVYD